MSQELKNLARRIAEKRGLDPELFVRLIQTESNFDPNARGAAGEIGLGQILPTTNANPGYGVKSAIDLLDPVDNLVFAADYLKAMINEFGDISKGVAAYNTGAGNVSKGIIPKSTQQYVSKVVGRDVPKDSVDSLDISPPLSRPSVLAPGGSGGVSMSDLQNIAQGIEAAFPTPKLKNQISTNLPATFRKRGRRSELRKNPNIGAAVANISTLSSPAGIASLLQKTMKKNRRTIG